MAFEKKIWKNRIVKFPFRRGITRQDGNREVVDVDRDEGEVTEPGDSFDADTMNAMEERIASAFNDEHRFHADVVAPDYDGVDSYVEGDYVLYLYKLYRCVSATTGPFDYSCWEQVRVINIIGDVNNVVDEAVSTSLYNTMAPAYNEDTTYKEGDYVLYNGILYICTGSTTGPFDVDYWSQTTMSKSAVKSATVSSIWTGTQEEYDAIEEKDPSVLYCVKEE